MGKTAYNFKDLTGQRFGRLTIISRANDRLNPCGKKTIRWNCLCDCGNSCTVNATELRSGQTKSCGCLNSELTTLRNTTHGHSHTRLWHVWSSMKNRCSNPKVDNYERYGGRGITVCPEWEHDFQAFYDWAYTNGYCQGLSIDRIDNNKGYSPDNCRWMTIQEQNKNKRSNIIYESDGISKTVSEWCTIYGQQPKTVYARLKRGWPIEKALGIEQ